MMLNKKTMTIKLRRGDVCDLLLACSYVGKNADGDGEKWKKLHGLLMEQLEAFDAKVVKE